MLRRAQAEPRNLLGQQPVGFAMNVFCGLGIWRIAEAKNLACLLVDPVFRVFNAIFPLGFHILRVCFGYFFGRNAAQFVNVHV